MSENPFFKEFATPRRTPPFNEINNQHYIPAIERGIDLAKKEIKEITSSDATPDFNNTIKALERSGRELDRVLNVFYPLLSAMSDDDMMEISLRASALLSEYSTSVSLDEKLWDRIKYVYDNTSLDLLDAEDRMLLKETYDSFARSGALLKGDDREEYKRLSSELSELTTRFGQNVLKELNTYKIWLTANDLAGLPEHIIEQASSAAAHEERPGEYLFTLEQPTYMAFMKYSARRDLREKFYRLYTCRNTSGEFSNMDIVRKISNIRLRIARLLGHMNYAVFAIENKMAHTPENVFSLLHQLRDAYRPALDREIKSLSEFASKFEGTSITLKPWDYSYYANKQRNALFDYDEELFRPYFKLERVIEGVFGLATKLYGITFRENPDIPVYHADVKAFDVIDESGRDLGVLFTDFFPRPSKQPGAWMTEFKSQWHEDDGSDSRPQITIVTNFTKPSASKPSLLTPGEVRTFLHEFGHALHGLFASTKYASLSGTNVRRDFVELPSQFNENFLTRKEFLSGFARHYITGEPLPDEMIDKIIGSSRYGAAYACLRQLNFGLLDMAWHTIESPIDDVAQFEREAGKSVEIFPPEEGSLVSPQFSHIFSGGYAAGYYSYKWAEVLDADAFSLFEANGVFDGDTARRFRECILSKGGTEDPAELYRRFRGKEPSISALLKRDGIALS